MNSSNEFKLQFASSVACVSVACASVACVLTEGTIRKKVGDGKSKGDNLNAASPDVLLGLLCHYLLNRRLIGLELDWSWIEG